MIEREIYQDHVKKTAPKSPMMRSIIAAFVVGGIICSLGEGVKDIIKLITPEMPKEDVGAWVSISMIFLGSFLTGIGVYDKIGHFAGAGSIVPILDLQIQLFRLQWSLIAKAYFLECAQRCL